MRDQLNSNRHVMTRQTFLPSWRPRTAHPTCHLSSTEFSSAQNYQSSICSRTAVLLVRHVSRSYPPPLFLASKLWGCPWGTLLQHGPWRGSLLISPSLLYFRPGGTYSGSPPSYISAGRTLGKPRLRLGRGRCSWVLTASAVGSWPPLSPRVPALVFRRIPVRSARADGSLCF